MPPAIVRPDRIDTDSVAKFIATLIEIPSVNPAYDPFSHGETEVAEAVGAYCRDLGCAVRFEPVIDRRQNVIARLPARDPQRTLLFEVHLDTVGLPSGELVPRAWRHGDRMYGRGACDVKGGLTAALLALTNLSVAPPDSVDVVLLGAADEEYEFRGISQFLDKNTAPDAAVVLEPTESAVVSEHNGVLRLELLVRGESGHTSRSGQGHNAIGDAATVMRQLRLWHADLMRERDDTRGVLTFTTISGGSGINIVPDACRVGLDMRLSPMEDPVAMMSLLQQQLDELAAAGVTAGIDRTLLIDGGMSTSGDHPLVNAALRASGLEKAAWVPFGTDGSKLARAGVPTIVFGPGSIAQAHGTDEWVDIQDVVRATQTLVRLVRALDSSCAK